MAFGVRIYGSRLFFLRAYRKVKERLSLSRKYYNSTNVLQRFVRVNLGKEKCVGLLALSLSWPSVHRPLLLGLNTLNPKP